MVETNQHCEIARLIANVNDEIPTTLLAFFPSYKLLKTRKPTFNETIESYTIMKGEGVKNIRLGSIGVFARTDEEIMKVHELRKR